MRYLDPKNDLVFKKIFGEHPNLLISFLNALLPLDEDKQITKVTYLSPEQVPDIPVMKNSIVDVKCEDAQGRQFIVEMQMIWTESFKARVLFNASKAYVRQLNRGKHYEILQPVYALSLVNENFIDNSENSYHHYAIVDVEDSRNKLDGLEFVFIELLKFKPKNFTAKKMTTLWLQFMTEIMDGQEGAPAELFKNAETKQALEILQESAFTKEELESYDRYWDIISTERTLVSERVATASKNALKEGLQKGLEQGLEQGLEKGMKKGIKQEKLEIARHMVLAEMEPSLISHMTGLSLEEIDSL